MEKYSFDLDLLPSQERPIFLAKKGPEAQDSVSRQQEGSPEPSSFFSYREHRKMKILLRIRRAGLHKSQSK